MERESNLSLIFLDFSSGTNVPTYMTIILECRKREERDGSEESMRACCFSDREYVTVTDA